MNTVTLNGITFSYIEKGTGPLVIAFHGFPDIPDTFQYQTEALVNAGYRVIAPYMRGYFPTTPAPDGCYHCATLMNDAVAFVNHFCAEGEQVILMGHDWGAAAAYGAAIIEPGKVSHLITFAVPKAVNWINAFISHPEQQRLSWYIYFFLMPFAPTAVVYNNFSFINRIWEQWSPGWNCPEEHLQKIKEVFKKPGVTTAILKYYQHNYGSFPLNDELKAIAARYAENISVNSLYIHGENDQCVVKELITGAEKAYTGNIRIELIKNAGHFVHLEQPETVNRLILEFLTPIVQE